MHLCGLCPLPSSNTVIELHCNKQTSDLDIRRTDWRWHEQSRQTVLEILWLMLLSWRRSTATHLLVRCVFFFKPRLGLWLELCWPWTCPSVVCSNGLGHTAETLFSEKQKHKTIFVLVCWVYSFFWADAFIGSITTRTKWRKWLLALSNCEDSCAWVSFICPLHITTCLSTLSHCKIICYSVCSYQIYDTSGELHPFNRYLLIKDTILLLSKKVVFFSFLNGKVTGCHCYIYFSFITSLKCPHSHLLQKLLQFSLYPGHYRWALIGQSSVKLNQRRTGTDFVHSILATRHAANSHYWYFPYKMIKEWLFSVCSLKPRGQKWTEVYLWWGCTSLSQC